MHQPIVFDLFIMFTAARVMGEIFARLRQPAVIGELLAGVLIGAHALGWVTAAPIHTDLAEIGVVILMFSVGLHTKVSDLVEVGGPAVLVGTFGVIVPFILGWGGMLILGYPSVESLFVATASVATSVGIAARVLGDMGLLRERVARIVLGAAILDDILALMVLAVVTNYAKGTVNWLELSILAIEAIFFILFLVFVGGKIAGRQFRWLEKLRTGDAAFAGSIILCLGLAEVAEFIGLAAIIGAFMGGMVLAGAPESLRLQEKVGSLATFLVPFFFVVMGMHLDVRALGEPGVLRTVLVVSLLAVAGKMAGAALGAWRHDLLTKLRIGICMVPRGEVGIVVGGIGLTLGTIHSSTYVVVVAMSILTTVIAPPIIKILFARSAGGETMTTR